MRGGGEAPALGMRRWGGLRPRRSRATGSRSIFGWHAMVLVSQGHFDEAIAMMSNVVKDFGGIYQEPGSSRMDLLLLYILTARFEDARRFLDEEVRGLYSAGAHPGESFCEALLLEASGEAQEAAAVIAQRMRYLART